MKPPRCTLFQSLEYKLKRNFKAQSLMLDTSSGLKHKLMCNLTRAYASLYARLLIYGLVLFQTRALQDCGLKKGRDAPLFFLTSRIRSAITWRFPLCTGPINSPVPCYAEPPSVIGSGSCSVCCNAAIAALPMFKRNARGTPMTCASCSERCAKG